MKKLEEVSDDVLEIFEEVVANSTIKQWLVFKLFSDNKLKNEVCKLVKSNVLNLTYSNGVDFTVLVNEEIFDKLPEDMKRMVFDEALAGIEVSENDVPSLKKPDFNTYTGVLRKYGDESVIRLHESIKSLFDSKNQKDAEDSDAINS